MRHYQRKKRKGVPIGLTAGIALILMGSRAITKHHATTEAYATLAGQVISDSVPVAIEGIGGKTTQPVNKTDDNPISDCAQGGIDWHALRQNNSEVAAWVQVDGTDISLPVLLPADGDMSFYLSHDLWRNPSAEGVPFLDHRCSADGTHRLVYGHHHTMGGQFSSLQMAYIQETFNSLGSCHWSTVKHGAKTLKPLCAIRVDMWFGDIQRFTFDDSTDFNAWLSSIAALSSARCRSWHTLASQACSAVTLVTCSSNLSGKQWRTLVLFAEIPA